MDKIRDIILDRTTLTALRYLTVKTTMGLSNRLANGEALIDNLEIVVDIF